MQDAGAGDNPEGGRRFSDLPLREKLLLAVMATMLALPVIVTGWFHGFWPWTMVDWPGPLAYAGAILTLAAWNLVPLAIGQHNGFGVRRSRWLIVAIALGAGVYEGPFLLRQVLSVVMFDEVRDDPVMMPFAISAAAHRDNAVIGRLLGEDDTRLVQVYSTRELEAYWRAHREEGTICIEVPVQQGEGGYRRAYAAGYDAPITRLLPQCPDIAARQDK